MATPAKKTTPARKRAPDAKAAPRGKRIREPEEPPQAPPQFPDDLPEARTEAAYDNPNPVPEEVRERERELEQLNQPPKGAPRAAREPKRDPRVVLDHAAADRGWLPEEDPGDFDAVYTKANPVLGGYEHLRVRFEGTGLGAVVHENLGRTIPFDGDFEDAVAILTGEPVPED
jgi:hypothetical protein